MTEQGIAAEVYADWAGGTTGLPLFAANAFITQLTGPTMNNTPDSIVLLIGSVTPPIIMNEAEATALIEAGQMKVPVDVLGRFALSRERAVELVGLLQTAVGQYDEMMAQAQPQGVNSHG